MAEVGDETAVPFGRGPSLIQNLGPGSLYVGYNPDVSSDSGLKLNVGDAVSISHTSSAIFAISDDTSDVRVLPSGTGIFNPTPIVEEP